MMSNKFTHAYSLSVKKNMTPDEYAVHFNLKQHPENRLSDDLVCSSCREKTLKENGDFHRTPMNIRGCDNYTSFSYAANRVEVHIEDCEYYSEPIPGDKKYKKRIPEPAETTEEVEKARNATFIRLLRALDDYCSDDEDQNDNKFIVSNLLPANYTHHSNTHGGVGGQSESQIRQRQFEKINYKIDWFDKLVAIYGKCHIDIVISDKPYKISEEINGQKIIRIKVYHNRCLKFKSNTETYKDGNKKERFSYFMLQSDYDNIAREIPESGMYKFVMLGYVTKKKDKYIDFELFENDARNLLFEKVG